MTDLERAALLWLLEDKRAELIHNGGLNAFERIETINRMLEELRAAGDTQAPRRLLHTLMGGGFINP